MPGAIIIITKYAYDDYTLLDYIRLREMPSTHLLLRSFGRLLPRCDRRSRPFHCCFMR